MAFIPWPNGVQLCFDFTTAGQNWQFCLALRKSAGAPTTDDLSLAADAGSAWWTTTFKPFLFTSTTLRDVRATDMTVEGGPVALATVGTAGTKSGSAVPLNAAIVVSGRTAKRGRSYRGRSYVSGLSTTDLADAVLIGSPTAANFTDAFEILQDNMDTAGFDIVVASRQHNGVPTSPAELNEVIGWTVDTKLDSQRRRLSGRGT